MVGIFGCCALAASGQCGNVCAKYRKNGFFARADASHFLLEYDTPRAGDFKPLRFKFGGFAKGVKPEDLLK